MTLAIRVIPTLLHKGGLLVKGQAFRSNRVVGHALQAARIHESRHVDELCIFDVAASSRGKGPDLAFVEQLTERCFMPVTYGGGVRSVEDVQALLSRGADKVSICSNATPELIEAIATKVGSQAIVVCIDVRNTGQDPIETAARMDGSGAGEIILQCVERDGTMMGYDLRTLEDVAKAVNIPVIASGGCKSYENMKEALDAGASAVAAGALFQFTSATPRGAAEWLSEQGIEVRL